MLGLFPSNVGMCLKRFKNKSDFCVSAIEIPGRVIKWDSLAIMIVFALFCLRGSTPFFLFCFSVGKKNTLTIDKYSGQMSNTLKKLVNKKCIVIFSVLEKCF